MAPKPIVLCLGDSHTFGKAGAAWVPELGKLFPTARFINRGVNGTQTLNVLINLDASIDALGKDVALPAAITLLIGTNDVMRARNCARNDSWGQWFYNNLNGDTGPVTLETWQQQYRALLATIASKLDARARAAAAAAPPASPAQVLLLAMTLPPLGEDLTDAVNAQVDAYNAALTQVVLDFAKEQKALLAKHSQPAAASGSAATAARPPAVVLDVKLVDISSECKAAIAKNQAARQAAGKWKPVVWPTPFFKAGCKIMGCQMTRDWWGLSYNAQSDAAGSAVITPDGIHINERGGDLVVGLLAAHLVKPLAAAPPPLQK